jgi:hypothetical protein
MGFGPEIFPRLLIERDPPERLELCSEVFETSDLEFRPGSLVPGTRWIPAGATGDVGESLSMSFDGAALQNNIALIRIPRGVLEGHLLTDAAWQDSEAKRRDLKERVDEVCRPLSSTPSALQHRGMFKPVRGTVSPCTTRHPEDRRLAGLHIDRLDQEPIATIGRPMSRFCINLGPRRRWFVFLPIALSRVVTASRLSERDVLSSVHFRRYVKERPDHVVCRIRLEPGEAYIAPTHLLLHDGQSDSEQGERMYMVAGPFDQTGQARSLSVV